MGRKNLSAAKMIDVEQVALNPGECKGAFVWWSLSEVAVMRSNLEDIMRAEALDVDLFMPPEVQASTAFRKAINKHKAGHGVLLRSLPRPRNAREMVVCVVNESYDQAKDDLDHDSIARIRFDKDFDRLEITGKRSELTDSITDVYNDYLNTHTHEDIRYMITRNISDYMGGLMARDNGGVYFVLAPYLSTLYAHKRVITAIGSTMRIVPIHDPGDLTEQARDSLTETIRELEDEVAAFQAAPPRADTLTRRLEEYEAIKRKLRLYSQMLGFQSADLQQKADDLDAVVTVILNQVEEEKEKKRKERGNKGAADATA